MDELAQSAVVFDDIDNIKNNSQKEAAYNILSSMLHVGWHHHVTRVVRMRLPTKGRETKRILNEAHAYAYFPSSAGGKIKHLLQ